MNLIKCPYCHASYYIDNYQTVTAMYYPPIYKDGININPDGNVFTHNCTCCNCGKNFTYFEEYGKFIK